MKRLYRFAFFVPPRDSQHTLFWHQLRDGEGSMYLREAILKAGIKSRFAGVIRNVPDAPPPSTFRETDVLIADTRFPLDDDESEDGRMVVPGDNKLEQMLGIPRTKAPEGAGCRFFRQLNRSWAVLQDGPGEFLNTKNRQEIRFSNNRGARCMQYRRRDTPGNEHRTVAFLIHLPHAWPGGPELIWSFGISGEAGLIWNKIVYDKYSRFLKSPHFVMAEFDIPRRLRVAGKKDYGPGDLSWATAKSLNLKLVAEQKLTPRRLKALGFV